jgi:hypothetical protein
LAIAGADCAFTAGRTWPFIAISHAAPETIAAHRFGDNPLIVLVMVALLPKIFRSVLKIVPNSPIALVGKRQWVRP